MKHKNSSLTSRGIIFSNRKISRQSQESNPELPDEYATTLPLNHEVGLTNNSTIKNRKIIVIKSIFVELFKVEYTGINGVRAQLKL